MNKKAARQRSRLFFDTENWLTFFIRSDFFLYFAQKNSYIPFRYALFRHYSRLQSS